MFRLMFLAFFTVAFSVDYEDKYCGLCSPDTGSGDTANHTMCIYQDVVGSACVDALDDALALDERQLILDVHNGLRSRVASGNETRGLPDDVPQPPAANMLALKWDEELARIAQRWADQCIFQHDCRHVEDFKVGQNIAQYWNNIAPAVQWQDVIQGWYSEVANWSAADTPKFRFTGYEMMTAHYTQVVWAETRFVGCGRRGFRNGPFYVEHYVCNYGPTGNYWYQPVYIVGEPCSLCPDDSVCSDGILCEAGSGDVPDRYAYRYSSEIGGDEQNSTEQEQNIKDMSTTPVPDVYKEEDLEETSVAPANIEDTVDANVSSMTPIQDISELNITYLPITYKHEIVELNFTSEDNELNVDADDEDKARGGEVVYLCGYW